MSHSTLRLTSCHLSQLHSHKLTNNQAFDERLPAFKTRLPLVEWLPIQSSTAAERVRPRICRSAVPSSTGGRPRGRFPAHRCTGSPEWCTHPLEEKNESACYMGEASLYFRVVEEIKQSGCMTTSQKEYAQRFYFGL